MLIKKFIYRIIWKYFRKYTSTSRDMWLSVKLGYTDENGKPIKCYNCGSTKFKYITVDYLDGICVLEEKCKCDNCKRIIGHWAHGYWIP